MTGNNRKKKVSGSNTNKLPAKTHMSYYGKLDSAFHLKLKHVLGGVSLLSLLAAFEVFSIPAGSGIIDFLGLTRISAAKVVVPGNGHFCRFHGDYPP
ncbi:MAG: hypothetical protein AMDU1_APLC00053G0003 [Thermoplasmatales archaeon A-plasma]|nr:MAG: hypothetical protein AMDU1_APLC00053G0003 [Thermoplasmatales archaeon A-plasma]